MMIAELILYKRKNWYKDIKMKMKNWDKNMKQFQKKNVLPLNKKIQ